MKFRQKMFYKIKRLVPMAGLAALTVLPTSCDPDDKTVPVEQTEKKRGGSTTNDSIAPTDTIVAPTDTIVAPTDTIVTPTDTIAPVDTIPDPRRDVELFFAYNKWLPTTRLTPALSALADTCINDTTIRNIYPTPLGRWPSTENHAYNVIYDIFINLTERSSKVRGRGNLAFESGFPTYPGSDIDSLWCIEHGWTIDKKPVPGDTTKRDIDILFVASYPDGCLDQNLLKTCANDSTIRNIYLTPIGHWNHYTERDVSGLVSTLGQQCMKISPKIRGRGNFDFDPSLGSGDPYSAYPDNIRWLVENGWTINGGGKER